MGYQLDVGKLCPYAIGDGDEYGYTDRGVGIADWYCGTGSGLGEWEATV
jgi:hypothetical protein